MDEQDWLARRFEQLRPRLRAVARRLLGSTGEADDAVQETWIRLSRSEADQIANLEAWLVTTVGRVALSRLRSRSTRGEEPLETLPAGAAVDGASRIDPEREVLLADSVGLALQVVLDTLTPAERLAYVLHDLFAVPFEQIATVLDRSPDAARQLASRGRRRIRGLHDTPEDQTPGETPADRNVVEAFLAAARDGDFDELLAVLDPDIVQRTVTRDGSTTRVHGAAVVAARAQAFALDGVEVFPASIDGKPGWVSYRNGVVHTIGTLTITDGRITTMDIIIDAAYVRGITIGPLTS